MSIINKNLKLLSGMLLITVLILFPAMAFSAFFNISAGYDFAGYYDEITDNNYDPVNLFEVSAWAGIDPLSIGVTYRSNRGFSKISGNKHNNTDYINNNMFISISDYQNAIYLNYLHANIGKTVNNESEGTFKYRNYGGGIKATPVALFFLYLLFDDASDIVETLEENFGINGYIAYRYTSLPSAPDYTDSNGIVKNAADHYHMLGVQFVTLPTDEALQIKMEIGTYIGSSFEDEFAYMVDLELGLGYQKDNFGFMFSGILNLYDFGTSKDIGYAESDNDSGGQIQIGDGVIDSLFAGLSIKAYLRY